MQLIVVTWPSTGGRSVFVPEGMDEPQVVQPEAWVGKGSAYRYDKGLVVQIGSMLGNVTGLFVANGDHEWHKGEYGQEILRLLKPVTDWSFADAFLKFWLGYVFGQEIELTYVEHKS